MAFNTPWPRVYTGLDEKSSTEVRRLTINLPVEDANDILSVALNTAIFSLICQTALKSAATYARKHKLTYNDAQQFVDWIRAGQPGPELPGSTNRSSPETSAAHPIPGGVKKVQRRTPRVGNVPTSPREETTRSRE